MRDPASGGFLEVGHAGFHGEERALQIGGEHCVPLLGRHVLDPRLRKDPGIGAEYVDAAIQPRRALRHLLQLGEVRHVGYGGARIAADFLRRGIRLVAVPRDDRDLRAVPSEDPRDALTDALARTSDDDGFSRNRCKHAPPPSDVVAPTMLLDRRRRTPRPRRGAAFGTAVRPRHAAP